MKNKREEFNNYYKSYIKLITNSQKKEFERCKKFYNRFIIEIVILVLLLVMFLYIISHNNMLIYYQIVVLILAFILFIGLCIINIKTIIKERKESCYVVNAIMYYYMLMFLSDNNFSYEIDKQISEYDFNKMNLFNMQYLNYDGGNFTLVNYKDKKLVMCDVWLYDLVNRIKTDSYYSSITNTMYITNYYYHDRVDIFKGLYYETTINRDNNKYIYLIPNNIKDKFIQKNIYHYISYDGVKVELENLEFGEKYSVFSFDEIKSRYVLSLTLMEKINTLDKIISNKKYLVFKPDGRVGIFIDGFQLNNLFNKTFSLKSKIPKDYIYKLFIQVNKLLDISSILEDINPYK